MSTPDHFRFALTKRQVNDLEDNLLLDGDEYVNRGVERPDRAFQFDLRYTSLTDWTRLIQDPRPLSDTFATIQTPLLSDG